MFVSAEPHSKVAPTSRPALLQEQRSTAASLLWMAAAAVMAFIVIWPLWQGMIAASDDLKFVRGPRSQSTILDALAESWRNAAMFRPLETIVGGTTDQATLENPWIVPIHGAALVVVALALVGLARRVLPGHPAVAPLAMLWVLFSPPTTVACWQVDTGSQSWSAALGALAMLLAWQARERTTELRLPLKQLLALAMIFVVGCTLKETFYGWSAAIGGAALIAFGRDLRRHRTIALRRAALLVPVVAIPIAHMAIRLTMGALRSAAMGDGESRYHAEFGSNLIANAALTAAASLGIGPFHAVTDGDAWTAIRIMPFAGMLIVIALVLVAMALAWLDRGTIERSALARASAVAAVATASTAATLPMERVSELYSFGSNIGVGVLVATAIVCLWKQGTQSVSTLRRAGTGAVALLLVGIGLLGLAGRAHHFGVTWQSLRIINAEILEFQAGVPNRGESTFAGIVRFGESCQIGRVFGPYIVPPLISLDPKNTQAWLARRDPERPISLLEIGEPLPVDAGRLPVLELDCGELPARGHW